MDNIEKKTKKSILNFLSLFFAIIGIIIGLFTVFYMIPATIKVNAPKCPNIEDARECWSYMGMILPFLIPLLISIIFYLLGKIYSKKIN